MADSKVIFSKPIKKIIISILLVYVGLNVFALCSLRFVDGGLWGSSFNISSQLHPDVIEWMAESDVSGKGVFILKLSRERTDQFFLSRARPEDQELPDDVFGAFIYINSFENDDIEHVFGRAELVDSTFSVIYQTKIPNEHLEEVLHDFYYGSHFLENFDVNFDEYLNHRYIDVPLNYFSGYELSSINAVGFEIINLEIFINGEKVDFYVSTLE